MDISFLVGDVDNDDGWVDDDLNRIKALYPAVTFLLFNRFTPSLTFFTYTLNG